MSPSRLFDWLAEQPECAGSDQLHFDSSVDRFAAHRFNLHKEMDITSHPFAITLRR